MCLVALALRALPGEATLIAANRDEFHDRPTAALTSWQDGSDIIAGRDMQAGGTWMGMTSAGRFAFVTNYRDPTRQRALARSRGELVTDYLASDETPEAYMGRISASGDQYNGFNLVVGAGDTAFYYSNKGGAPRALPPGIYLLSNHLLDSPWPKSERLRTRFTAMLRSLDAGGSIDMSTTLDMLRDTTVAADDALPRTGLPLDRERLLSSPFIVSPQYGTRSSAVMHLGANSAYWMAERRYDAQGTPSGVTLVAQHPFVHMNGHKHYRVDRSLS